MLTSLRTVVGTRRAVALPAMIALLATLLSGCLYETTLDAQGGGTMSVVLRGVNPKDVEGVKALAVAAQRCFADWRPGGMRVIAGSVILESGLQRADFDELFKKGVRLAKAGFGAVKTSYDYVPLVTDAKAAGLLTTCHTGGSSIPGSGAITGDSTTRNRSVVPSGIGNSSTPPFCRIVPGSASVKPASCVFINGVSN